MKFRTMLFASATAMFVAGNASALDLNNPFGVNGEGIFSSDTKIQTTRTEYKNHMGKIDATSIYEELEYGITDNFSLLGSIQNDFDTEKVYNNDHNFTYGIGFSYFNTHNDWLMQFTGMYNTYNPKDYYGKDYDERWNKSLYGDIKLGYDMGDGLIPYMSYSLSSDIDTADRYMEQSAFAGFHKDNGSWASDAGLRYDYTTDKTNKNAMYVQGELAYYPADNLSVAVYGDYYLGGTLYDYDDMKQDKDYTTGLRIKYAF